MSDPAHTDPASSTNSSPTAPAPAPARAPATDAEEIDPTYPTVELWVIDIFTTTWMRQGAARWCARWWQHAEAVIILSALWRSWEATRIDDDPRAWADWLTRCLYPLLHELTAPGTGPFAACTSERHSDPRALDAEPAPEGYWPH